MLCIPFKSTRLMWFTWLSGQLIWVFPRVRFFSSSWQDGLKWTWQLIIRVRQAKLLLVKNIQKYLADWEQEPVATGKATLHVLMVTWNRRSWSRFADQQASPTLLLNELNTSCSSETEIRKWWMLSSYYWVPDIYYNGNLVCGRLNIFFLKEGFHQNKNKLILASCGV